MTKTHYNTTTHTKYEGERTILTQDMKLHHSQLRISHQILEFSGRFLVSHFLLLSFTNSRELLLIYSYGNISGDYMAC